jgi:hypothetical protein
MGRKPCSGVMLVSPLGKSRGATMLATALPQWEHLLCLPGGHQPSLLFRLEIPSKTDALRRTGGVTLESRFSFALGRLTVPCREVDCSYRGCQSNGNLSRVGRRSGVQRNIHAAMVRHSAGAAERRLL